MIKVYLGGRRFENKMLEGHRQDGESLVEKVKVLHFMAQLKKLKVPFEYTDHDGDVIVEETII